LLLCTAALASSQECRTNYQLMGDGRCIRPVILNQTGQYGVMMAEAYNSCKKDGAYLPIIRSEEENTMFNGIVEHFVLLRQYLHYFLGLVCNAETHRYEWMDGSKVTYTKGYTDLSYDCVEIDLHPYSYPYGNFWPLINVTGSLQWTALCVDEARNDRCGDYESMENFDEEDEACFKIFTEAMTWNDAQAKCASDFGSLATINSEQENKFFWRSAVANNVLTDMHIGAYQQSENSDVWQWIEDNSFINGSVYNNFAGVFPIPGGGSCVAMLTESSSAKWMNEDCDDQKLPFLCRRTSLTTSPECPEVPPKAGEDIFPPGFPHPSTPCEYTLVVAAGSVVQLDILALEAIPYIDFLEIYEGAVGSNMLANLTDTKPSPSTYTTKSSNVMRVNWKPVLYRPPQPYRGFRIQYRAIAKGQ
ncbi:hypothetical protein PFISCL1PPCAC_28816, partial [Pristionchus fissidentatus]